MFEIKNDTKIYIFCPPLLKTGGPEALHQLYYYLKKLGYNVFFVYNFSENTIITESYVNYVDRVISYKEVEDKKENIIITAESQTYILKNFNNVRKCVWWLSYNNYDKFLISHIKLLMITIQNIVKRFLNLFKKNKYVLHGRIFNFKNGVVNLCACYYAYEKLSNNKKFKNVEMLVEPISKEFINVGKCTDLTAETREDTVLYNPAKPSSLMSLLLKRNNFNFVPIRNMSIKEIIAKCRSSKLYVDFGEFPGAERLPKETVYNGTCLLVGKQNAAENDFDVKIPNKYKIENFNDVNGVEKLIADILENYNKYICDFAEFREKIDNLENNFLLDIKKLFRK